MSLREGLQLGHNYVGTEHILLGLIREGEGGAAQVLVALGADLATVRYQTFQLLGDAVPVEPGRTGDDVADQASVAAGLARQLADARDLARRLRAQLPARTRQQLMDDHADSIPSWVRDRDAP